MNPTTARWSAAILILCGLAAFVAWWAAPKAGVASAATPGSSSAHARRQGNAAQRAPGPRAARPASSDPAQIGMDEERATRIKHKSDPRFLACEAQYEAAVQQRAQALAASPRAEDLVGYVVLSQSLDPQAHVMQQTQPEYVRALATAVRLAPDDSLAAWLYATHCANDRRCDAQAAAGRLVERDPQNLATWLLAMDAADRRGDARRARDLLRQSSVARHVDFRMGELALRQVSDMTPLPPMPACDAAPGAIAAAYQASNPGTSRDVLLSNAKVAALMWWVNQPLPLEGQCPANRPWTPHDDCRHAFEVMATSADMIPRLMALARLQANARTTAERDRWRAQQRDLEWLNQLTLDPIPLHVLWEQGEIPALIAQAQRQGHWPPPHGWQRTGGGGMAFARKRQARP